MAKNSATKIKPEAEQDLKTKMPKAVFEKELKKLQRELVLQQQHMIETGKRVVVIFEGRDAAGKGGVSAHSGTSSATPSTSPLPAKWCCLTVPGTTARASST
jgi:polyphosphate kinase 2 (PPK2 family)